MRILICNRRHCLSAGLIIIGSLALWSVFYMNIFYLLKEMDAFYHLVILGGLAFYGLYFGIFSMFLDSRNSISRTFTRIHNVIVLSFYVYMLFYTYNVFYIRYYRIIDTHFSKEDFGEDSAKIFSHLFTVRYIAILCTAVALVQAYLIYARFTNWITKSID